MSGAARFAPLVRRLRPGTPGSFERVHDGLVAGWLHCTPCGLSIQPPVLLIDGCAQEVTCEVTARDDVPGGRGFLFRFKPTGLANARVQVRCPIHLRVGMEVTSVTREWTVTAIGTIEAACWPTVNGWLAFLDPAAPFAQLMCNGFEPITIRLTEARTDVEEHLGRRGVGGFRIDLSSTPSKGAQPANRTAVHDGALIQLVVAGRVLASSVLEGSPLGLANSPCLARPGTQDLDEKMIAQLRRRFLRADIDPSGDWRTVLAKTGMGADGPDVQQWANYLGQFGESHQVAAWLGLRAASALANRPLNPLPASLDTAAVTDRRLLPARVGDWAGQLLGSRGNPHEPTDPACPAHPSVDKVAVSGLIHHRSGLGQNARNSLDVLKQAGIHGCEAPFYPSPGGWNPNLCATPQAINSLADHAILLHLPIDRVIPSLAAQPALLRSDLLIGYFMWETEVVPREFHRALDVVDEIWTASRFVADTLRAVTDTPIYVTGHLVRTAHVSPLDRAELGIHDEAFVVHYAFDANSTVARKNPNGAIDAFHRAFEHDPSAVLVLKIRNMQQVMGLAAKGDPNADGLLQRLERDPSIRVVTGERGHGFALGLIELADCYLSMHRSEGYGYGIAEAMALGTPVIATGYSGSTDLTVGGAALLVPYQMIEVAPEEYFYWEPGMSWADPEIDAAADLLRRVRDGHLPDLQAARSHIKRVASLDALGEKYRTALAGTAAM